MELASLSIICEELFGENSRAPQAQKLPWRLKFRMLKCKSQLLPGGTISEARWFHLRLSYWRSLHAETFLCSGKHSSRFLFTNVTPRKASQDSFALSGQNVQGPIILIVIKKKKPWQWFSTPVRTAFRDLTSHSNIWHVLSRRLNTWRALLQKSMERNDNCSLECLLHRLFLTSSTLSNHGACIRWYWKGSVHRFLFSKNTLPAKPFHKAGDSQGALLAPVLLLCCRQGPKANAPQELSHQPRLQGKDTEPKNQELSSSLWRRQPSSLPLSLQNTTHGKNERCPVQMYCEILNRENKDRAPISVTWCQQSSKAEATKCRVKQNGYSSASGGRGVLAEFPHCVSPHFSSPDWDLEVPHIHKIMDHQSTPTSVQRRQQAGQGCTASLKDWTALPSRAGMPS